MYNNKRLDSKFTLDFGDKKCQTSSTQDPLSRSFDSIST